MATIRQNFVHIYILCLRETFSDARKNFARALVAFDLVTPSQVIIHLFGIDGNRRRFGHAIGDTDKIIDAVVTVQEKSNHARKPAQKDFRNNHHDYNLVQQGMANRHFVRRKSLFRSFKMEELDILQFVLDPARNKPVNKRRQQNNCALVENVNHEIGNELRIEAVPVQNVVERNRKRRRDALAKIEPVQSVSKDGANATANQREQQNDNKQLPNAVEEPAAEKECRKRGNQDAQDAIVSRDRLRNSIDGIHAEAHDDRRQVTAKHRSKHGAQTVQEQRYAKENCKFSGDNVQKQANEHQ